jgi:hypothetical protein
MTTATHDFREIVVSSRPMRELGLSIEGTPLEATIEAFKRELRASGLDAIEPRFYLSTEWGVPFQTIAIAIPFYLANIELMDLHGRMTGWVEGTDRDDVLRYLRHEMGHVINYGYVLYERPEWVKAFGSITQPYEEQYRPVPWSNRFVRHLPGWYAQKHPDEDWAETFAVWLTPDCDWRRDYAEWPVALAKLQLCDRIVREVGHVPPPNTADERDEDLTQAEYSLASFYDVESDGGPFPPGLDGSLRSIFAARIGDEGACPAATFIRSRRQDFVRAMYTWTGHFPEQGKPWVGHLERRAEALSLAYPKASEQQVIVRFTAFATSMAMTHVHRGTYLP